MIIDSSENSRVKEGVEGHNNINNVSPCPIKAYNYNEQEIVRTNNYIECGYCFDDNSNPTTKRNNISCNNNIDYNHSWNNDGCLVGDNNTDVDLILFNIVTDPDDSMICGNNNDNNYAFPYHTSAGGIYNNNNNNAYPFRAFSGGIDDVFGTSGISE